MTAAAGPPPVTVIVRLRIPVDIPLAFQHSIEYVVVVVGDTTCVPPEALRAELVHGAVPLVAQHEVTPLDGVHVRVLESPLAMVDGLAVRDTVGPAHCDPSQVYPVSQVY